MSSNCGDMYLLVFLAVKFEVAEGVDFWAPVRSSARELIEELQGGLRSGLTYGGARNIKELQRKAEFVEVTATYQIESLPRP